MKNYRYKTGLILIGLFIFLTAQIQIQGQDKADHINLNYILSKLTFTSRISKSTEQINEELIKEIQERKVDFILDAEDEEELKIAGASDLLIKTIDKSASDETKKILKKNYFSLMPMPRVGKERSEKLEDFVKISKQFVRIFEADSESKFLIDYLKAEIPNLEKEVALYKQQKQSDPPEIETNQPVKQNKKDKYFEKVQSVYKRFTDNYRGRTREERKMALEAAKEFVEKFGEDKDFKVQTEYLKKVIPKLEQIPRPLIPHPSYKNRLKFDQAYKNQKWDDLFEIGEEILKDEPEFVDVAIVLASVGYDKIAKENPKSENLVKAVYYAEKAIELLEAGTKSETKKYGAYDYEYKTKEFPDGRANALGWMNYIIGYIKYFHLNEKDAAIPYFRKSIEYESEVKKFAETMPISNN